MIDDLTSTFLSIYGKYKSVAKLAQNIPTKIIILILIRYTQTEED